MKTVILMTALKRALLGILNISVLYSQTLSMNHLFRVFIVPCRLNCCWFVLRYITKLSRFSMVRMFFILTVVTEELFTVLTNLNRWALALYE
jgi:hypothetical protein